MSDISAQAGNTGRRRIVFFITQFEAGGAQSQLALRLQNVDLARFDCRLAILTDVTSHLLGPVVDRGIPVDFLHVDRETTMWRRVRVIRDYLRRLEPVDVVTTCLTWDHVHVAIAAALAGVPLIVSELQNELANLRRGFPPVLRFLELLVLNFVADRIVCCSDAVYQSYRTRVWALRRKGVVIKNSIDLSQPLLDAAAARRTLGLPDSPVVGAVGRLAEQKDLSTLLRAIKYVHGRGCRAYLAIVGDGPLRNELVAEADRLGLASHVRFIGVLPDPRVLFAAIDVFAMSSRWEGLPIVLLEAMAAGRASACTDAGGTREALLHGQTGLLCRPGDAAALATNLHRLLTDDELRQSMAVAALSRAKQFDIHESTNRWQALFGLNQRASRRRERRREQWPTRANRILLFRLCPVEQLLALVSQLRTSYPEATIDCICQSSLAERLQAEGVNPIEYGPGRFSVRALGPSTLRDLRRRRYDLAVVPFNHSSRQGYLQAELCALLVRPTSAIGVVPSMSKCLPLPDRLSYSTAVTVRIDSDAFRNMATTASAVRG